MSTESKELMTRPVSSLHHQVQLHMPKLDVVSQALGRDCSNLTIRLELLNINWIV